MPGNRHHQLMRFFTFILSFRKLNGLFKSSPLGVLYSIFCSVLSCPRFLSPEIVSWIRKRWKELLVSGREALSPGDEKQAGRWCHGGRGSWVMRLSRWEWLRVGSTLPPLTGAEPLPPGFTSGVDTEKLKIPVCPTVYITGGNVFIYSSYI